MFWLFSTDLFIHLFVPSLILRDSCNKKRDFVKETHTINDYGIPLVKELFQQTLWECHRRLQSIKKSIWKKDPVASPQVPEFVVNEVTVSF